MPRSRGTSSCWRPSPTTCRTASSGACRSRSRCRLAASQCALEVARASSVVVCYEMADEFAELYRQYGRSMAFTLDQRVSEVRARRRPQKRSPCQKQKSLRAKRRCDSRVLAKRPTAAPSPRRACARPFRHHGGRASGAAPAPCGRHADPLRQVSRAFCSSVSELYRIERRTPCAPPSTGVEPLCGERCSSHRPAGRLGGAGPRIVRSSCRSLPSDCRSRACSRTPP